MQYSCRGAQPSLYCTILQWRCRGALALTILQYSCRGALALTGGTYQPSQDKATQALKYSSYIRADSHNVLLS